MARILVLGGGPAGLESALYLATRNQEVILVDKKEKLGGSPLSYNCKATDECRRCGACLVSERVYQVHRHPLIQVLTESNLSVAYSEAEIFRVKIMGVNGPLETEVSGIILATGFELLDPSVRGEMGYLRLKQVITAREMEEKLRNAKDDWEEELGALPRIAIIRCFGSREQSRGVSYCSRVCCLYSKKMAEILIDRIPGATVDVFYMDGQRYHPVYATGSRNSIRYIRSMPARIDKDPNENLIVRYEDASRSQIESGFYDWVVLCPAIIPMPDNHEVYEMLGVEKEARGFIASIDGSTSQKGIFAAGCCIGPQTIVESLGSGQTAAGHLLKHLASS